MEKETKLFEESIESTIKSISRKNDIVVEFKLDDIDFKKITSRFFLSSTNLISLPKINQNLDKVRALSDIATLYLAFHNKAIHSQQLPSNQLEQEIFEEFEKFRLILVGGVEFKGMALNLDGVIKNELISINPNLPAVLLLKNSIFEDQKLVSNMAVLERFLSKEINNKIEQLRKLINDQGLFVTQVLELINLLKSQSDQKNNQPGLNQENKNQITKENQSNPSINQEESLIKERLFDSKNESELVINHKEQKARSFSLGEERLEKIGIIKPNLGSDSNSRVKPINNYRTFTKRYDEIVKAESLSNNLELKNLRKQLDLKIDKLDKISHKLSAQLKRKLLSKKTFFFEDNKDEGLIDRKKISQVVIRPLISSNYVTINEDYYQDTVISLLIDNSGSMRGAPIIMSAMASEIISKILEKFAIKVEILGFTTSDWRGGKSKKLWEAIGKPANPGRLSDLRHIIYKNSYQTFKKSRDNLGLMLRDGVLKENIDGEALIWAASRLVSCNEKRKILIVISDGTPIDDSTNANNNDELLINHLHQTIKKLEKHSEIEIAAIGIGHDVSDFYQNSITIKNIEELGDVMINKICDLL